MFKLSDQIRKVLGLEAKDNETDVELGARVAEAIEQLKASANGSAVAVDQVTTTLNEALAGFKGQLETVASTITQLQTEMATQKTANEAAITELKTSFSTELAKLATGSDPEGNDELPKSDDEKSKDKKGIKVDAWKTDVVTVKQML
jgi:hypothetical protein